MEKIITFLPFAFVVIVIVYEKFRQKKIQMKYDEMQLEIRGRGAWYGFYALILYWAVIFLMESIAGFRFLTAGSAVFLGVMVSGSVIVGYSILHDSYYGMNVSGSGNIFFIVVIAAIETVCVVYLILLVNEGMFADLKTVCTDSRLMLPMCIPMFTTILVTTLIRRLGPGEEGDE